MAGQPKKEVRKWTTKATKQKNKKRGLTPPLSPKVYHEAMKILSIILIISLIALLALYIQGYFLKREQKRLLKERDELAKKSPKDWWKF